MSQQGKLKRYLLILERLKHAPTLAELSEHLSDEGFELNYRTIQRDLAELRDEFGVDTVYDRSSNTYSITGDEEDLPGLMQLLERAQLLELVRDGGQGLGELRRYIHFEELGRLRGIKHIAPLLRAIRERREVKVLYQKFYADTAKRFRIQPHLLKEYRGRWYVLGPSAEHVRPIALGLDRIKEITMLAKRFKRYDRKIAELYDQAIGVDTSPEVPERSAAAASFPTGGGRGQGRSHHHAVRDGQLRAAADHPRLGQCRACAGAEVPGQGDQAGALGRRPAVREVTAFHHDMFCHGGF